MYCYSNEVVVLKGGPTEHLLVSVDSYPGTVHSVDTLESAVDFLHSADRATIILTDAVTANEISHKVNTEYLLNMFFRVISV